LIDEADREAALFYVRWLQAPHRIGAVAPSSRECFAVESRLNGCGSLPRRQNRLRCG